MSQIFNLEGNFESRLRQSFRGDAGEQKKQQQKFRGEVGNQGARSRLVRSGTSFELSKLGTPAGASSIFKLNLGGTTPIGR